MSNKISRHGFTIVELVIVIVIIAILAALTMFGFSEIKKKATDNEYKSKVTTIMAGLEKYYEKNGEYPTNIELNPEKKSLVTDFTEIAKVLPGTSASDFKASDGHSFIAYCSTSDGCPAYSTTLWNEVYSKSFIYLSRFPESTNGGEPWMQISQPVNFPLGWGCKIETSYDKPGFIMAWRDNENGIWHFYRSKNGVTKINDANGGPTQPGQECKFTEP